jgi:hypothetical protein
MSKQRSDAMYKAKDYLKGKELMMALASAKAALIEDQKIGALTPIKEKLARSINDLAIERKREEMQPMTFDKLKDQMTMNPAEKLKELVSKWISDFEDMLGTPTTSINLIDEIANDLKSNPVDLFKKLRNITELGDFDEGVIDIAFNPQVKALSMARELLSKKDTEIDGEIREYHKQKQNYINQAKDNIHSKNYVNALMMLKTLPVFEGKIQCGYLVKKALTKELKEIEDELEMTKTSKPDLAKLKSLFSADQVSVMSGVIGKWLSKQQKIVSELVTSPRDMLACLSNPISLNPLEIVKELNNSGLLPKIDLNSFMKDNVWNTATNAAGSILDKFRLN